MWIRKKVARNLKKAAKGVSFFCFDNEGKTFFIIWKWLGFFTFCLCYFEFSDLYWLGRLILVPFKLRIALWLCIIIMKIVNIRVKYNFTYFFSRINAINNWNSTPLQNSLSSSWYSKQKSWCFLMKKWLLQYRRLALSSGFSFSKLRMKL